MPRIISPKKSLGPVLPERAMVMARKKKSRQSLKSYAPVAPALNLSEKSWEELKSLNLDCKRCGLCQTRTHVVFGEGNPQAELMFIGEAPGENEDLEGRPFVGRSGQLLEKMILAMGKPRDQVFIANIVRCRPPDNRVPGPDEVQACLPYLKRQIELIKPKVIVCLGKSATHAVLNTDTPITELRGKVVEWEGAKLIPTYHPAYLLRAPQQKKVVWEDLLIAVSLLGWPMPKSSG